MVKTENPATATAEAWATKTEKAAFAVLAAISFCHLLNDMVQSLLPAIYPILKSSFHLDFGQIGLITFTYQVLASLLQPVVGYYTDKRPQPYSLPIGMGFTLIGLVTLSLAASYLMLLVGAALVGVGSSVFHPESSRVARLASGGQHGLAQSIFQVGGNFGSSLGPLVAAFIVLPRGQHSIAWFSVATLVGIAVLINIGSWYRKSGLGRRSVTARERPRMTLPAKKVAFSMAILTILMFSKYIYLVSLSNYYTFYVISKFHVSVRAAQILLFVFLGAIAAGTIIGGPLGDRIGRKYVIWWSILGVLPFTLALPYSNLFWTAVLTAIIGVILASAFPAIVVYAQDLMPHKIGTISGVFFGFAFGMGGIGAALLGQLADRTGIDFVYQICSYLPAFGLLAAFLPTIEKSRKAVA